MANIFKQTNDVNNDVNRNTFDLSFQNNLTLKFGTLYPVFLKEGLPGSSFMIKPSFGLNFMPMVFPVQTRMRAYLHFFKVRKRSLWDGFMDYVSKNKASLKDSMPYLDLVNQNLFNNVAKTGSLGDYLGIPTTRVGDYGNLVECDLVPQYSGVVSSYAYDNLAAGSIVPNVPSNNVQWPFDDEVITPSIDYKTVPFWYQFAFDVTGLLSADFNADKTVRFTNLHQLTDNILLAEGSNCRVFLAAKDDTDNTLTCYSGYMGLNYVNYVDELDVSQYFDDGVPAEFLAKQHQYFIISFLGPSNYSNSFTYGNTSDGYPYVRLDKTCFDKDNNFVTKPVTVTHDSTPNTKYITNASFTYPVLQLSNLDTTLSLRDLSYGDTPYYDSVNNPDGIKLNALPFRAYEAIYNAFYRNILNDPFILDGTPEYNKFLPTTKGGADVTPYTFHARYWEDDFLTTAIQNPQASDFPVVVGITNLNGQGVGLSVRDEEGNNYQLKATISEDGKSITKFDVTDLPQSEIITNPKAFIDLAQSGISITDFRCANALQRWLEMNARKGLRFKDIIKGRFDVDIRFDELNMPEFIGGDTADVNIGQINQSVGSRDGNFDDVLGSYAGQASCMKRSDNAITTFCDEPCYIIGLLSVVPVANYSQLLPKLFTKRDILDEFSPEFAHIGYQPIPYAEVCPTQAYKDSSIKLTDPFGYQRAWYDYIASTDEVHGQFRTSLRNFLVNRVFGSRPILSHSFLTVNNDDINDIFSVTSDTDKILGQVYFDCQVKHPIPKFGIPKLEA